MFCHKCGAQIAEGAAFCYKCGEKAAYADTGQQNPSPVPEIAGQERDNAAIPIREPDAVPVRTAMPAEGRADYGADFRAFVDNHVRATTKYQSAEELINCRPMAFVWICFGAFSLIGLIMGGFVGLLVIGGFFGYSAVFIASAIIRKRCWDKFYGEFEGEIDIEGFRAFLDANLNILSPYFHGCGYLKQSGGLQTIIANTASKALKEVILACVCGPKEKSMATICIRPDVRDPDSGRKQYIVGASHRGFLIDSGLSGLLSHACLIRTAPIMQAAIKFYLNQNNV